MEKIKEITCDVLSRQKYSPTLIPLSLILESLIRLGDMRVILFSFSYSLLCFVPLDYRVSVTRFITALGLFLPDRMIEEQAII